MRSSVLFAKSVVSLAALAAAGTAMAQEPSAIERSRVFETGPVFDSDEERWPGFSVSEWTSSDRLLTGTNGLRPGRFTAFGETRPIDKRLLVGIHPQAGTGSVEAAVRTIEPAEELLRGDAAERIAGVGPFYQIWVDGVDGSVLKTAHDTGFFIALPVPEGLDPEALVPIAFAEGALSTEGFRDSWVEVSGPYDPETGHLILSLENLGSAQHPTRVGVVAQRRPSGIESEPVLRPILTELFPGVEEWIRESPDLDLPPSLEEGPDLTPDPGEETMIPLAHRPAHTTRWSFRCRGASSCSSSLESAVETVLDDSLARYVDMNGNPRPSIGTTWGSKFMPNTSV